MNKFALVIGLSLAVPTLAQEVSPVPSGEADQIFIVPDVSHPWAAAQIGGVLDGRVSYQKGTLLEVITLAKERGAAGIVEIKLDTSAAFESGRVVCYLPNGRKLWEEKVMFNLGGGTERIARRFADALEKKVAGKRCGTGVD